MKIALTLLCLGGVAWADSPVDLIVVAGQSNAVGFDADAAALPQDDADQKIMFWWRCGDPPPDDHDSIGREWSRLQPQPKGSPLERTKEQPRQYGNFAKAGGGFGPEIGLARTLYAAEKKPLAVVKTAFSGTGLRTDWNQLSTGDDGACYRAMIAEIKLAMAAAGAKGQALRPRALVWIQGESDANAQDAPHYEARLGAMIEALRKELSTPGMVALIGVNTQFGNGRNKFMPAIVAAQQHLCTHLPHSVYVSTDGSTYANEYHFDTAGTLDVGRRFARALLALEAR